MSAPKDGATVVVVGAGGNIGSHLVPHLARSGAVARLVLVDPDEYEVRNLASQDIRGEDVGRAKVAVQAERIRAIRPDLVVEAHARRVESVPRGLLHGDLLLTGLDTRRARCAANLLALRLGMPWIDGGVRAEGKLGRVDVRRPSANTACFECGWDDADYDLLDAEYSCVNGSEVAAPTSATSSLGALVASVMALEAETLFDANAGEALGATRTILDLAHRRLLGGRVPRDPKCRVADHSPWRILRLPWPWELDLDGLTRRMGIGGRELDQTFVGVEGLAFARASACAACGLRVRGLRLVGTAGLGDDVCGACGGVTRPLAFATHEALVVGACSRLERTTPLEQLGLRAGDVVTVAAPSGRMHAQLGGESA